MEVILHKDNSLPLVAVNIWYKVGSANEVKGKTGLAHLFEHMMFQGSENIPKEMHFRYIQEAGGTLERLLQVSTEQIIMKNFLQINLS